MIKQVKINERDGAEMVWVPEGEFLMGDDRRRVHLDGYWINKYPVTVEQYLAFCEATGHNRPVKPAWGWRHDHPIVAVSWRDASGYCAWAEVSLPTEAEWEKAARGTDGREFPWGNEWNADKCRCSQTENGDARGTAQVTDFFGDVSPCGARHMAGNVCEWCNDWDDMERSDDRVVRGGPWAESRGHGFRCAERFSYYPGTMLTILGFRCAFRPST
jgi:sulfatase modifying factor 1